MSGGRLRRGAPGLVSPRGDATSTLVLNVVGLVLIGVAWAGASGHAKVAATFPYVNLGVAGVLVVAMGNTIYLYGFRRAVRNRLVAHRQSMSRGGPRPD